MSSLNVQLVAADRKVWEGQANGVYARTVDGEIGILPGHQPLLSILAPGEIKIDAATGGHTLADVDGGFLSVDHDTVTIVVDSVTEVPATAKR